jgi:hypothetical protein
LCLNISLGSNTIRKGALNRSTGSIPEPARTTGKTHVAAFLRGRMSQSGQNIGKAWDTNLVTDPQTGTNNREMAMSLDDSTAGNLNGHRQTLGVCWLVYGVLRLIMGICLVLFSGTATVMFGALLSRVADPFALMSDFHIVYAGIVALAFLCGILGLLAGLTLLANQRPARLLALIAAFLSISEIPFGTTLGIYTLIVLLLSRSVSVPVHS